VGMFFNNIFVYFFTSKVQKSYLFSFEILKKHESSFILNVKNLVSLKGTEYWRPVKD
jgi:hypothetical protein